MTTEQTKQLEHCRILLGDTITGDVRFLYDAIDFLLSLIDSGEFIERGKVREVLQDVAVSFGSDANMWATEIAERLGIALNN
jgi:hypothetical protein